MITVVTFFRFRPLSQNLKEQQTVTSSKPKSGATSASRLSRKTWKEDGKNSPIFSIHVWSDANTSVNDSIVLYLYCVFYLLHMIVLHKVTVRKKGVEKGII